MKKKIGATLVALMLAPTLVLAGQLEGTVVKMDKGKKEIVVKTESGEKKLQISSNTKGLENAKEGAKVMIEYSVKNNQLKARDIAPSKTGSPRGKSAR